MSDKYYRGLKNSFNDMKHKFQLASITLKINENKNNISEIRNDISEINNFSDKTNDNENSISNNLSKIEDNVDDIDKIKSNLNNILSDFKINYSIQNLFIYNIDLVKEVLLDRNNNSFKIFSYNIEDDFKLNSYLEINSKILYDYTSYDHTGRVNHTYKFYDIKNTLFKEIKFLKTNSGDNLYDNLSQNDLFYVKIPDSYSINKIELFLELLYIHNNAIKINIINPLKSNFICIKHYKKINTLSIDNNLTDLESNILSNLGKINDNSSDISSNSGKISTNENDISTNSGQISTNTSAISSNLAQISTNKSNISSNLININANEDNIAYNLNEINYLKNNNKSTQYLKNIYNILIYDSKTQIDFRKDIFHEKVFDFNANQNDFVEIFFKIQLEYQDTDDRHYVKSIYELFDENNNSLYVKSVNNNEYLYFSNKMTIDENIFYNFTKSIKEIKFVIKFQKLLSSRLIKIFYIKNNNYRLIMKHYGN